MKQKCNWGKTTLDDIKTPSFTTLPFFLQATLIGTLHRKQSGVK